MITNLIKSKKFKGLRTVTFIKDFCLSTVILLAVWIGFWSILGFVLWQCPFKQISLSPHLTAVRVVLVLSVILASWLNKASHKEGLLK